MTFYTGLAKVAKRQLKAKGQLVTVTRENEGSFDPGTGLDATATDTTFTANAAIFDYKVGQHSSSAIEVGDMKVLMESDTEPKIGDKLASLNGTYNVINVTARSPSGVVVMYELQCRS